MFTTFRLLFFVFYHVQKVHTWYECSATTTTTTTTKYFVEYRFMFSFVKVVIVSLLAFTAAAATSEL